MSVVQECLNSTGTNHEPVQNIREFDENLPEERNETPIDLNNPCLTTRDRSR
jgi:hypothetical protein